MDTIYREEEEEEEIDFHSEQGYEKYFIKINKTTHNKLNTVTYFKI